MLLPTKVLQLVYWTSPVVTWLIWTASAEGTARWRRGEWRHWRRWSEKV